MAEITRYPLIRRLRAEATDHVQLFRDGRRRVSGRGKGFWFRPDGASIAQVPLDDRPLPMIVKGKTADFQEVVVNGTLRWRADDPERLAERIDFTIDLASGRWTESPVERVEEMILALARQVAGAYLRGLGVREALERGPAPLRAALLEGLGGDPALVEAGIAIAGVAVADLRPTQELARALEAPTFEALQQEADEAGFARRAAAVEKERAIAENELANRVELAARQRELIDREGGNAQAQAEAKAAASTIESEAEAERIRVLGAARSEAERERLAAVASVPPATLTALAMRDLAGKLKGIDHVTVTPDMLAGAIKQLRAG